jgi:lysophospholipase L1-like esterase
MIKDFKHWQKIRFSTLNDSVQVLFKNGELEPGLLDHYINYPDRITIFNDQNHPATNFAIQEMNNDFKKMSEICNKYNSDLIFINIPINYFTGHEVIRTPSDILNSYFEKNNNIDSIYRSIANTNNLPYIELTNHFIGLQNKSEYLFKYDGHPNEKGYEEIAKYIGRQLIEKNHMIKKD